MHETVKESVRRASEPPTEAFTVNAGGIVFGPYGPDKCPDIRPGTDIRCEHWRHHIGGHSAEVDGVTYRW